MHLLRKISYGEFSEFVQEKKVHIRYIYLCILVLAVAMVLSMARDLYMFSIVYVVDHEKQGFEKQCKEPSTFPISFKTSSFEYTTIHY